MKKRYLKYIIWHVKKVNLTFVLKDTWWVDSCAPIHISVTMQGCLYLYLIHEKSQSLDVFKSFKAKVEHGKKIKAIKYNRGGEYYGRIIMTLVAYFDLELHQMDVKTAFLNGDIDETIYMVQPEIFV
ncbi:hypothetical protein CR513_21000, partial [Mucuna pruriens]